MNIPVHLRRLVIERAHSKCEYCGMPESFALASHQIDHIIALKHGGQTNSENLALSCALCNKYKGSDIASIDPETGQIIPLYHPRKDKWSDHFYLDNANVVPETPAGRVTVHLLQINQPNRVSERLLLIQAGQLMP
jgi:hypothetical protein